MRILEVAHGFPPYAQGGSEIYAHAHACALARSGDEVAVLTREHDATREEYSVRNESRDGLRIVWVNNTFSRTRSFAETYRNEPIGDIAAALIDEFRPDVAHVHHLTCLSTTIVATLARRRIPCFLTLHDYWLMCHRGQLLDVNLAVCDGPGDSGCQRCLGAAGTASPTVLTAAPVLRAIERSLPAAAARRLRRAAEQLLAVVPEGAAAAEHAAQRVADMREVCAAVTHFVAPSRYMRDRFLGFGVPPQHISVAGYGFDLTPFTGLRRCPSPRLRFGFLGSLMVSKAPDVLLRAFARLPHGAASLSLFGAPVSYHGDDSYRREIEPLLAGDGVTCHGGIPHDRVAGALSSIDVLVAPSIWPENSPLVIQEAFLAGVPVIASRIGGIPEVVVDGQNGLLVEPGSVEDLHRALLRLVDEPGLLATLRSGILPVRSIDEDVGEVRHLYERCRSAGARRKPRLAAIVLNYRTADDTLLAVRSLRASRRPVDQLIVVDNDPLDERCQEVAALVGDVTYLRTCRNLGFSGGMNVGIREALSSAAEIVMLVNSDAIIPPDCVEALERCLDTARHGGIVGPVLRARSDPGCVASVGMTYAPRSGRMRHLSFGVRTAAGERRPDRLVDGVSGCVVLVKRAVFDSIGLLDEDYFYSFEDLDFCVKARGAGFTTMVAGSATAYHEGSHSIGADSPRRLYFAARNHLLMARRTGGAVSPFRAACRTLSIVALNLAHAVKSSGGSLPARLQAVSRGTADYMRGRVGADK